MNKFSFDKKEPKLLKIQIEGHKFAFNPYTLTVKKAAERFTKCQEPLVNRIKKKNVSKKDTEDIVFKSCILVKETVNSILGKGSYEKIFGGRTVDFLEHQQLIAFLFEEITKFSKENPVEQTLNEFAA